MSGRNTSSVEVKSVVRRYGVRWSSLTGYLPMAHRYSAKATGKACIGVASAKMDNVLGWCRSCVATAGSACHEISDEAISKPNSMTCKLPYRGYQTIMAINMIHCSLCCQLGRQERETIDLRCWDAEFATSIRGSISGWRHLALFQQYSFISRIPTTHLITF